ncbi:MAG: hypothetical protein IH589_13380 [Anaerolineales bacterium]|nr:hypothetical protein [Anaerolineales bacterium]
MSERKSRRAGRFDCVRAKNVEHKFHSIEEELTIIVFFAQRSIRISKLTAKSAKNAKI